MKAIANSLEPKGMEPGLFAHSVRPVTGFGFEQLFSVGNALVSEETTEIEAELLPVAVEDGQALAMMGPVQTEATQFFIGPEALVAQLGGVPEGQTDAAQLVPVKDMPVGAEPVATEALAFDPTIQPADSALLIDTLGTSVVNIEDIATVPAPVPVPGAPTGAKRTDMPPVLPTVDKLAAPTDVLSAAAPVSENVPPVLQADAVLTAQPHAEAAVTHATPALTPDDAPPRIAAEEAQRALHPKPMLPDLMQEDAEGEVLSKRPVILSVMQAEKGGAPGDPAPVIPTETATKPPNVAVSPVAAQLAKASIRGGQPVAPPSGAETVLGDDPNSVALGQPAREQADPYAAGGASSRASLVAGPQAPLAVQLAKTAMQSGKSAGQAASRSAGELPAGSDGTRFDHAQSVSAQTEPQSNNSATSRAPTPGSALPPGLSSAMPMAGILNMRQADWGKQFIAQIERMAATGSQRIELSLRPKNLGEIQISLDLRGDQTHVHIATETAAAARLLGGAEDRLAQMLEQSGYRLSGFSAQENGTGGQQGQNGQQGQQAPRRNRPAMDTAPREEPADASAAGPYSTDRGKSSGINMLA